MKKILIFSLITSVSAALVTYYRGLPTPSSEPEFSVMQQTEQKNLSPSSAHASYPSSSVENSHDSMKKGEKMVIKAIEKQQSSADREEEQANRLSSKFEDNDSHSKPKIVQSGVAEKSEGKASVQQDIEIKITKRQDEQESILEEQMAMSQDLDEHCIAELKELAGRDSRAAFDLGLRYFRGDGVEQNSYQAIEWMRKAGERGNLNAQAALGRIYLSGLEEMGPDFQEAHKWLLIAASRGDEESSKLLTQAQEGRYDERKQHLLKKDLYMQTYRFWYSTYAYKMYWHGGQWLVY